MKLYMCLLIIFHFWERTRANLNVLLIIVDDLRPSLGAYGDLKAVTPNIDQLAKEGVIFTNAFAQQALCGPSRTSFLTSRRPDTLKIYDVHEYWRNFSGDFTTLPQYFKENFYYTKSIGKVFHPGKSSNYTDDYPQSWSTPAWHPPTEIYKNAPVCQTNKGWFANLYCPVKIKSQPHKTLPDIEITKEAIKFFKSVKNKNQPFFLAVGYHKPHIPFKFPNKYANLHPMENISLPGLRNYPPLLPTVSWNPWNDIRLRHDISNLNISYPYGYFTDYWAKKIRQGYYASVSYIDNMIGKLLANLKMNNLHRNTVVALMGDHGWSLGEHGEWSKYSNFDVALRVPLIFRIPNVTYFTMEKHVKKEGLKVNEPVELVDLFPTLVDLANLTRLQQCPQHSRQIKICTNGISLSKFIKYAILKKKLKHTNKCAFSQYPRPGINSTKTPDSDQPRASEIRYMGYTVRTERYRYTEWVAWNTISFSPNWSKVHDIEFYDHHIDPNEDLNLAGRPGLNSIQNYIKCILRKQFQDATETKDCSFF